MRVMVAVEESCPPELTPKLFDHISRVLLGDKRQQRFHILWGKK